MLQHEGVLISYIAKSMSWAMRNKDLFDVAKQEGRLLVLRAIEKYDGSVPISNFIYAVLAQQLRHRVRESEQKSEGEPISVRSIDSVDEQLLLARPPSSSIAPESVRRAVQLLLGIVSRLDVGPLTARAVIHAAMVRTWGNPNYRLTARRRAIRYGAKPAEVDDVLTQWRLAILRPD